MDNNLFREAFLIEKSKPKKHFNNQPLKQELQIKVAEINKLPKETRSASLEQCGYWAVAKLKTLKPVALIDASEVKNVRQGNDVYRQYENTQLKDIPIEELKYIRAREVSAVQLTQDERKQLKALLSQCRRGYVLVIVHKNGYTRYISNEEGDFCCIDTIIANTANDIEWENYEATYRSITQTWPAFDSLRIYKTDGKIYEPKVINSRLDKGGVK